MTGMSGVAVVTGASRGLGAALVAELVTRGFTVAGCSRHGSARAGVEAVDVSTPGALDAFAAGVHERLGPIDVWVNNAGVVGPIGPVRAIDLRQARVAVDVNLLGTLYGSRAFLAHARNGGVLVNISSRVAKLGAAGLSAYSATKAAIVAMTQAVAAEEASRGIRAVVILPPSVDTDMQDSLLAQDPEVFPGVVDSHRRKAEGTVLSPGAAAGRIVEAVFGAPAPGVLIDLT